MKKELASVRNTLGDQIKVFIIDTEKYPALSVRFGVGHLPTVLFFKNGEPVHRIEGFEGSDEILEKVKSLC